MCPLPGAEDAEKEVELLDACCVDKQATRKNPGLIYGFDQRFVGFALDPDGGGRCYVHPEL